MFFQRKKIMKGSVLLLLFSLFLLSVTSFAKEEYKIRVAIVSSATHPHNISLEYFAKLVKAKTNGEVQVTIADNSQLGGERDYIEGMQLGTIQMAQVSTAALTGFIPEFKVFSLPYIFKSQAHLVKVVKGTPGKTVFAKLEGKGLKGLAWFDNGFRSVYNKVRPIKTLADIKGMKIRVMQDPVIATFNALGALPVPMAYGELYSGIQQGVVDGAENSPWNVLSDKYYEVCKYYSLTNHFAPPGVILFSKSVFDRYPKNIQRAITNAARETQVYEFKLVNNYVKTTLDQLRQKGMTVNELDVTPFRETVKPLYKQFSKEIGSEIIEQVTQIQ